MTETTPPVTPAPPRPQYKYWYKVGFSFGFFSFLVSPIILFQSVLMFLFLLVLKPTQNEALDSPDPLVGNLDFLMTVSELLFFSILLFIAVNLMTAVLGIMFDKRRLWAIIGMVLTLVSLGLVFIAPRLIDWKSDLVNFF